jgi:hypothetical protein
MRSMWSSDANHNPDVAEFTWQHRKLKPGHKIDPGEKDTMSNARDRKNTQSNLSLAPRPSG